MLSVSEKILQRTLKLYLSGTRGGPLRLQILMVLAETPSNINAIAKALSIDYKTAQHHIRVLEKSGLITSAGRKYDNAYTLSAVLRLNHRLVAEILQEYGKKHIRQKGVS